ncbi:Putative regulator AbrB [Planktothrix tepida]|uniref:Membrane protein AbrB duplication n=2 Tax=Planktothrix TaxID=54304 RepID=A0A1J1LJ98_9CYAN|nr:MULTISPECIES: AbrB family transcriptional regulator [Planktothrix]CAD5950703.1 Putative regulator AbrB [Planktothrix tepida]CAD5960059.1 Putative regulator AbrB [Planktothrix pseudagardhii]CUR32583.1 Membrane protein AbrB duplication [Planktothrix tepida PCC 9214]
MNIDYQNTLTHLRQEFSRTLSQLVQLLPQLMLAVGVGYLFNGLHFPVGWLIGPMVAGILYAVFRGKPQPLPPIFFIVGQAIVAIATATGFSLHTLGLMKTYAFPLIICIVITGGMSVLNGYLLGRWGNLDRATGFLSCVPGASYSLIAMSEAMGADAIAVALLQYLRILLVAVIVPTIVGYWFAGDGTVHSVLSISTPNISVLPPLLNFFLLASCGGLGIVLGEKFRLPSSLFFGPFLVSLILFWILPYCIQMPPLIFTIGLLFVGFSIGLKFDWNNAKTLWKAVLIEIILVLLLILFCLGAGYIFHEITQVDTMTAILGSTPGGITAMIATVIQLGGDSGIVLAMQMTRMLLILLISPWFGNLLIKNSKLI